MEEESCDNCVWRENGCDCDEVCEHYREESENGESSNVK